MNKNENPNNNEEFLRGYQLGNGVRRRGKRYPSLDNTSFHLEATSNSTCISIFVKVMWILAFITIVMSSYSMFIKGWNDNPVNLFVDHGKKFELKSMHVPCSPEYLKDTDKFTGCKPKKCGRYICDNLISMEEVDVLLGMFKKALTYGESAGGASVLDLVTGALSKGLHFINLYKFEKMENLFKSREIAIYKSVREKIKQAAVSKFSLQPDKLYYTKPTFFSKLNSRHPLSPNDEYWHIHADTETYAAFHYTSLLYLNNVDEDFKGGRFNFLDDKNSTTVIEPKKGKK